MDPHNKIGAGGAKGLDFAHSMSSRLNYRSKFSVDTMQKKCIDMQAYPISTTEGDGPIEVNIVPSGDGSFLDLSSLVCDVEVKFTRRDGKTACGDDEDFSFVNNLSDSLFKSIEPFIDKASFDSQTTDYYGYKNTIEKMLTASRESRQGPMLLNYWYEDTPGKHDEVEKTEGNDGYKKRAAFSEKSQTLHLSFKINLDITRGDKYLPPDRTLGLRFNRQSAAFLVLGGKTANDKKYGEDNYAVPISSLVVNYSRVVLVDGGSNAVLGPSQIVKIVCPKTVLRPWSVSKAATNFREHIHTNGCIPTQIIVAQVNTEAFNGHRKRNPYNFEHLNISEASIVLNGRRIPFSPTVFSWTSEKEGWQQGYRRLMESVGIQDSFRANMISPEVYRNGGFFIVFDLTPDKCNGAHLHKMEVGPIELNIKWGTPLAEPASVLVECTYQQEITLLPKNNPHSSEVFQTITF